MSKIGLLLILGLIFATSIGEAGKYKEDRFITSEDARQAYRKDILAGLKKNIGRSFYALPNVKFQNTPWEWKSRFEILEKEAFVVVGLEVKAKEEAYHPPSFKIKLSSGRVGYKSVDEFGLEMATEVEGKKCSYYPRITDRNLTWPQWIVPKVRNETFDKIIFQSIDWFMTSEHWWEWGLVSDTIKALKFHGYLPKDWGN